MKPIALVAILMYAANAIAAAPAAPAATVQHPSRAAVQTTTGEGNAKTTTADNNGQTVAPAPPTAISGTFTPASFKGSEEAIFDLVVRSPQLAGTTIVLSAPSGFHLEPQRFPVPVSFSGSEYRNLVKVSRTGDGPGRGRSLIVRLQKGGSTDFDPPLAIQPVTFDYAPLLGVSRYLIVGLIGIIFGYLARAATKLLSSTKPPDHQIASKHLQQLRDTALANKAPQDAPSAVHVAVFRYWYAVDFTVTVLLGGLVLVATMKDGLPPVTASYWHTALTAGFALGLLTNSELLTRVKV